MKFSEKIDVSTQYITDLERGIVGCSVPTLLKICDVLDVSTDFILRGKEPDSQKFPAEPEEFSDLSPPRTEIGGGRVRIIEKSFLTETYRTKKRCVTGFPRRCRHLNWHL